MIPFDASGDFHPVAEASELRRLAVRGAAATVSAQWLGLVLQIVGTVLLARLLTPADFGVVAMALAQIGWGYWALVIGIIGYALSVTVGAWWLCRWIPSMPRRGVGTRAMIAFAANVYGRFTANYFSRNFDTLLIGWQFNAA